MILRRWLFAGLILFLAFIGYEGWKIYAFNQLPSDERARILSAIPIEGKFSLYDHNARTVSEASYAGRFRLVFFGYTWCPDVCPTVLNDVAMVMDDLGATSQWLVPIFITVDPARDTVTVLKDYVGNFHPDIIGLTGSPEAIAAAARSFRVVYGKVLTDPDSPEDYSMSHSAELFLMGPDGTFIKTFSYGFSYENLISELRTILDVSLN